MPVRFNLLWRKPEVDVVNNKAESKAIAGGCPDCFFGKAPAAKRGTPPGAEKPVKKKEKKKQTE